MALYQRRESVGRTRFLLALSLSTLTAIAVAAPLAIQAVNTGEPTFAAGEPGTDESTDQGDLLGAPPDRSLDADETAAMGGIVAQPAAKGQGHTSKTETEEPAAELAPVPDDAVMTNTDEAPTEPADEPESPVEPPAPTTTTTAPPAPTTPTTTPTTTETVVPEETTSTTDAEETTSTDDPDDTTTTEDGGGAPPSGDTTTASPGPELP